MDVLLLLQLLFHNLLLLLPLWAFRLIYYITEKIMVRLPLLYQDEILPILISGLLQVGMEPQLQGYPQELIRLPLLILVIAALLPVLLLLNPLYFLLPSIL